MNAGPGATQPLRHSGRHDSFREAANGAASVLGKHRIGRVQPGEPRANLLRARCHIAEVPNRSPA